MDPISLAGLSLGVTSLAFDMFAGCVKGFVLLSTTQRFDRDSSALSCMLSLQELQLFEWASRVGLLADPPVLEKRLNEPAVCAVLRQLKDLLLDTEKLKSRYKMSFQEQSSTLDRLDSTQDLITQTISREKRAAVLERAEHLNGSVQLHKRLWWAAADKKKFEELVEQIKAFIRELWNLLDPLRQDEMTQNLQTMLSHVISVSSKIDDLTSLQAALQMQALPPDQREGRQSLASAARMKGLFISSQESQQYTSKDDKPSTWEQPRALPPLNLNIDLSLLTSFKPLKNSPDLGTALLSERPVFVEWKTLPASPSLRSKILSRAQSLATLLSLPKPHPLPSLHCEGIIHQSAAPNSAPQRIAFVFTLSASYALNLPINSLRNLFSLTPSVTSRIALALKLVQTLHWFHTAGWLHKDICSSHILLWPNEGEPILSSPLFAGFAFARGDDPCAISEQPSSDAERDIYRHPDAMGEPSTSFTKDKDVYALGCVLLEIGEWRSLRSLVAGFVDVGKGGGKEVQMVQLARVKGHLLDQGPKGGMRMLGFRMGEVYERVVRMMLSGEIPEEWRAGDEGEARRLTVLDVAIRRLRTCVI